MYRHILCLACCLLILPHLVNAANEPKPGFTKYYNSSFTRYLERAHHSKPPQSYAFTLQAVGRLLQDNQLKDAERLLNTISYQSLTKPLQDEYWLTTANLYLLNSQPYFTLKTLQQIPEPTALLRPQQIAYYSLLAMANKQIKNYTVSTEARIRLDPLLKHSSNQQDNREQIWHTLNQLSTNELAMQIRHANYDDLQGWLSLAYIYKMYHEDESLFASEQQQWKQRYQHHPGKYLLSSQQASSQKSNRGNQSLHIALLLPNKGPHATAGAAIKAGFMSNYYDHQHDPKAPVDITVYDTTDHDVQTVYRQAVHQGANVVVGPLIKHDVARIEAMGSALVPTLGLNRTHHSKKTTHHLFEYALSPHDEAQQVAKKILRDGASRVLVIIPAGNWGKEVADAFTETFHSLGGQIIDTATYQPYDSLDLTIKQLLKINNKTFNQFRQGQTEEDNIASPRRTDFDAIFMIANPTIGRQIKPLLQFYFADNIPVYSTSEIYTGVPNPNLDRDLNGIIFCDMPFNLLNNQRSQHAHQQLAQLVPKLALNKQALFAFGQDAYLIATHLSPLKLSPYHQLDGLTGRLYLDNQQILRQLLWATFKNGVPVPTNS